MADIDAQLDETVFYRPDLVQFHQGIKSDTVLWYIADSPFWDPLSNNNLLLQQSRYNPSLHFRISTRKALEQSLDNEFGVQFVVSHDPTEGGLKEDHNGVWVIQKRERSIYRPTDQERRRFRPGELPAGVIEPLQSYYVKGEQLYQAPSIGDIVGNRLMFMSQCLNRSLSSLEKLVDALADRSDHTEVRKTRTGIQSAANSFETSQGSKEATPAPQASQPSTIGKSFRSLSNDDLDISLLSKSLVLSNRHQDEYMDENPLRGEPGSFVMQKSRTDTTLVKPSEVKTATPLQIKTNVESNAEKGSKESSKTPVTPSGSKRRKKSRLLQTTTPK